MGPRAQQLDELSYLFDESFTWKTISFPWSELLERVGRDNQPPLYYALLQLWAGVWGDSLVALRSFSVLCGMLTVAGVYLFVREAYAGLPLAHPVSCASTCFTCAELSRSAPGSPPRTTLIKIGPPVDGVKMGR